MQEESFICSCSVSHMQKDKRGRLLQMDLIRDVSLNFRVQNSSEHGNMESELFAWYCYFKSCIDFRQIKWDKE